MIPRRAGARSGASCVFNLVYISRADAQFLGRTAALALHRLLRILRPWTVDRSFAPARYRSPPAGGCPTGQRDVSSPCLFLRPPS